MRMYIGDPTCTHPQRSIEEKQKIQFARRELMIEAETPL